MKNIPTPQEEKLADIQKRMEERPEEDVPSYYVHWLLEYVDALQKEKQKRLQGVEYYTYKNGKFTAMK